MNPFSKYIHCIVRGCGAIPGYKGDVAMLRRSTFYGELTMIDLGTVSRETKGFPEPTVFEDELLIDYVEP